MVIRPPSEADSYILQVTYGCSHNRCTFCGTYSDKPFRVRPIEEVLEDIALARAQIPDTRRVFLADGNALVLDTERLVTILDALASGVPPVAARGNLRQRPRYPGQERRRSCRASRSESWRSSTWAWRAAATRCSAASTKESRRPRWWRPCRRLKRAGMRASVIALLGLGGTELSAQHAEETGRVVSAMDPEYLSMLTLMLVPGTELHRQWQSGTFELPEPAELLHELRQVIAHLDGLSRCIFRTNHASNYLPLAGTLSRDKARLLAAIDEAQTRGRSALRPEAWRAL